MASSDLNRELKKELGQSVKQLYTIYYSVVVTCV